MRYLEIIEARRNPEQNPRVSVNSAFINRLNSTTSSIAGVKNAFVSFTTVDKLGVNPRSKDKTPIGIYSYPLEYVVDKIGDTELTSRLPYAGDREHANIFSMRGNIINLTSISSSEVEVYYDKIRDLAGSLSHDIDFLINEADKKARHPNLPGGRLWYVTWAAANTIFHKLLNSRPAWAWTALFRRIGVDGCVDLGSRIIHEGEPTQAVAFSIKNIVDLERVYNKYSPEQQDRARVLSSKMLAMTPEEQVAAVLNGEVVLDAIKYIRDYRARLEIIAADPRFFEFLHKPNKNEVDFMLYEKIQDRDRTRRLFYSVAPYVTAEQLLKFLQQYPRASKTVYSVLVEKNSPLLKNNEIMAIMLANDW